MKVTIMKRIISFVLLGCSLTQLSYCPAVPTNFFNPYDIHVVSQGIEPGYCSRINIANENSLEFYGFQPDDEDMCQDWRKRCNPLQLWQDSQDALAAVKGNDTLSCNGQFAQIFNIDDDNGTHGHLIPHGNLELRSLLFSYQWALQEHFNVGFFLPLYWGKLSNVSWTEKNNHTTLEDDLVPRIIAALEKLGNMNLYGWTRSGFGDATVLFSWLQDFPQAKSILRNVRTGLRGGLNFPTGKKEDINQLLAIPFGWDGGAGIIFDGYLELTLDWRMRLGLDVELMHLFGNTRTRRIKTDLAQTDLLFMTTACSYKDPGFTQHFTIFGEYIPHLVDGLTLRASYEFMRHNEDKLFLNTNAYDVLIANSAESLQDWTTHTAIFQILYEPQGAYKALPNISFFYKHGFNGKRALLANTIGFTLGLQY